MLPRARSSTSVKPGTLHGRQRRRAYGPEPRQASLVPRLRTAGPARQRTSLPWTWIAACTSTLIALASGAAIEIEGLTDRAVLTDRARFRVVPAAGATDAITLDDRPLDPAEAARSVEIDAPDFHELRVRRTASPGGAVEERSVRFVVRASERGSTETGLPPWTPPAPVPASPAELAGATLRWTVPARYPAGMPVPQVAWLEGPAGRALRLHATLTSPAHPPLLLRRGVGAGWLSIVDEPGLRTTSASVGNTTVRREMEIIAAAPWTVVGGSITGPASWPADSLISLERSLTLATNAVLEVGPGAVVRLGPGVDVVVHGVLRLLGTADRPVVFVPALENRPWGGFILRGAEARVEADHAVFAGSGADPAWFDTHSGYDVHRSEQALFLVDGARLVLRDCAAFDGAGQFGHGKNADLEITRTLVQRFITGGEYSGGSVRVRASAFIEFPNDDPNFADADNDALYFTSGRHEIVDSLIGWAKDDGIDAGSGGAGSVLVSNVWAEAIYHEAFAWSGEGRAATNLHCVALHCGQGIECGWSTGADSPRVVAGDCLLAGNATGARFGDNYDWSYNGRLQVTNSLLLHNHRDIFDLNWNDWMPRTSRIELRDNLVSTPHPRYPDNAAWNPQRDAARLAPFLDSPIEAPPGYAFALHARQAALPGPRDGLSVGLSRPATAPVRIGYTFAGADTAPVGGFLDFSPGEALRRIPVPESARHALSPVRVHLHSPSGAVPTGPTVFHLLPPGASQTPVLLVPSGARWRYLDTGIDPGDAWPFPGFDDSRWLEGPAELGYGDGDEATVIGGGPSNARHSTAWFRHRFAVADPGAFSELEIRLRRDDGGLVHLNGREAFRSNLPSGPIHAGDYTGQSTSSESTYFNTRIPASFLRPGENLLAVEVHQADPGSSDLSFDLVLAAYPATRLAVDRSDPGTVLLWQAPGFVLESAPSLQGPWQVHPDAVSPHAIDPAATSFHRLRRTTAAGASLPENLP